MSSDFNKICRFCMKEADVLLPLFPETKIAHKVMALMPTLMVGMKTLFTFSDNSRIKTIE